MPAEAPLALGPPLRHLGEILDLILPDLPLLNWGHSSTFVLLSFPRNAPFGLPGPPEALFGLPAHGVGATSSNICVDLSGVDVVLRAKFQAWGQTVWLPILDEHTHTCTHTHTDSHL